MLARPDLDAILVATPPSRHHAMALAALRAGKHVWVEKPLALTAADGRELVDAARAAGKTLFVDETFLYDPLVREMKRVIDAGELGDVFHLSFERLGMGRIRRDSNVWWNSAPHDLSILFYLVPRAGEVDPALPARVPAARRRRHGGVRPRARGRRDGPHLPLVAPPGEDRHASPWSAASGCSATKGASRSAR